MTSVLKDFFKDSVDLTGKIQSRKTNIDIGKHKVKFKEIKLCKSTRGGKDRIEFRFEILETDSDSMVLGKDYSIPYFKDENNYGLRAICNFVYQTLGLPEAEKMTYGEALENAQDMIGNITECTCWHKKNSSGELIYTKKGGAVVDHSFTVFEGLDD